MKKEKKISRRSFLKSVSYFASLPALILWAKSAKNRMATSAKKKVILPLFEISEGITFHEAVIIHKTNSELKVFSSSCTHLGCKISSIENGELVCPCHGSRFDENGKVINGPALKPLEEIEFSIDRNKDIIQFYV